MYATGIVLCTVLPLIIFHPMQLFYFESSMKMKIGCTALIYDKVGFLFLYFPYRLVLVLHCGDYGDTKDSLGNLNCSPFVSSSDFEVVIVNNNGRIERESYKSRLE